LRLEWVIEDKDNQNVFSLIEKQSSNQYFLDRMYRNVSLDGVIPFSRDRFWKAMLACLMSTQQKSGPGSYMNKYCLSEEFSLDLRTL
jgi:hypothetical protein